MMGLGLLCLLLNFSSCKKDKTIGIVEGYVTDASSASALAGVRLVVFDANTNAPTEITTTTDADGMYSIEITTGTYYLKLSKQGYEKVPPPGIAPLSFDVVAGETTTSDYEMNPSSLSNAGWISGNISVGSDPVAGALVVAVSGQTAYSSTSDAEGNYVIYNVPQGTYNVMAYKAEYNSSNPSTSVSASTEVTGIDVEMTMDASATVEGQITFLATTNIEVDVALVHPITAEAVPGLNVMTSGHVYNISNVPNGDFIARASYQNDGKVVDPDWLIKNGEPIVTIPSNSQTVDFSVTGAVDLNAPTNTTTTQPVEVSSTSPTFEWDSYSSSSDYIIEVRDANGNLIWGGFDLSGALPAKNIVIPSSQTSIQFNSDGNATENLEAGQIYTWRIYASKDAQQEATGWKLISVSEDQKGIIKIAN